MVLILVPAAQSAGANTYAPSITPTSVIAGAGTSYTFTVADSGSSGKLGAVNATIPSGYGTATPGAPTTTSGKTWTASVVSGVLRLRAANNGQVLSPGDSVSVSVTATAPTITGSYTWTTTANSAIDLSGTSFANSGTDPSVLVTPAALGSFAFDPVADQIAGNHFGITVRASDIFGNFKYDYNGTANLSNLANSPDGSEATYNNPLTFTGGIANGDVTAVDANDPTKPADTSQLKVTGDETAVSNTFKVGAAAPAALSFFTQPNDAQPLTNPPTCTPPQFVCTVQTAVKDLDRFGNPEIGVNVTIQLQSNPGNDFLAGTGCTGTTPATNSCALAATSPDGIATFSDLTMQVVATAYKLQATSGPAPAVASGFFNIANTVKSCGGNCNATATKPNDTTATATATNVNGNLSVAIEQNVPSGSTPCSQITQQVGSYVTVNPTSPGAGPTLEVTGTLFHKNNGTGVGNSFLCKNSGPGTAFHIVQACSQVKPKNTPPCYVKLSGNGQGDIFFDLLVAYDATHGTFDPGIMGGH